jgi:HCOMODA/2-hydroxy-3-carboxy-muconic semialdehyde decarboxylase
MKRSISWCVLLAMVCGALILTAQTVRQTKTTPREGVSQIDELVLANHILTMNQVLDAYGHVSVRSDRDPKHFFLAQHIPAGTVRPDDIVEYDFDSNQVGGKPRTGYTERFIHGEIYRARPDVMAVVHCHSPDVLPFTVTNVPLRPMIHMAGFLVGPVPVFEIRNSGGITDMLIRSPEIGRALAKTLADNTVVLLRGHGAVVVAPSLHVVAGRSYYLSVNARALQQAIALGGGKVTYLDPGEARKSLSQDGYERSWELWKQQLARGRSQ